MKTKCLGALLGCLVATAALGRVAPAPAAPSCAATPQGAPVFQAWGDPADYVLAGGGSFEAGAPSWTLSGDAAVTPGNDPLGIAGGGSQSLTLPAGASATSACLKAPHDRAVVRFALRAVTAGAAVHVELIVGGGKDGVLDLGTVGAPSSDWGLSDVLQAAWPLRSNGAVQLQVRLTSVGTGTAQIDDVFVDPYMAR
jgi:hypothetical protein